MSTFNARTRKLASAQTIAALALAAAAGCGETEPLDETGVPSDIVYGGVGHIMPKRDPGDVTQRLVAPSASSQTLKYYGGKVIGKAKVVQVIYGTGTYMSGITGTGSGTLAGFYEAALTSSYMNILTQYNTSGTSIGKGSFASTVTITPSSSRNKSTITDANVQAEIAAQISAGKLPAPDANTIYMVNFPKGKKITMGGSSSCAGGGFCAYHNTFKSGSSEIFYGVLPDMEAGSGCDSGCGSGSAFGNQTSVASHELIETITDPEIGLATDIAAPIAWYNETYGEIGDICNGEEGSITGYTVQKEWSNSSGSCVDH